MMSPPNADESGVGESSSYQHMEQALSKVAADRAMEDSAGDYNRTEPPRSDPKSSSEESGQAATTKLTTDESANHTMSTSYSVEATAISAMPQTFSLAGNANLASQQNTTQNVQPSQQASASALFASASSGSLHSSFGDNSSPIVAGISGGPPRVIQTSLLEMSDGNSVVAAVAAAAVASMAASEEGNASSSQPITIQAAAQSSERSTKSRGGSLRRGKWTAEEEAYVARVIQDFNSGFLNAPAGTTLRSYLSDKLQCDPMRITKKFTGEACIGKRVFHPAVRSATNANAIDKAQAELETLEKRWRRRLEMQQRESAKKTAASVAAANAATRGSAAMVQGVPVAMLGTGAHGSDDSQIQQTAVTQAASWLDRANAILRGTISAHAALNASNQSSTSSSPQTRDESTQSSGDDSLESQMREVQRLIYEGPAIQQTAAAFPNLLIHSSDSSDQGQGSTASVHRPGTDTSAIASGSIAPDLEPADKRLRTSGASATSGAEDAEALIGFLSSVRASAAAGHDL
ncbi:hypothetical protein IV203_007303 [Nitzschia inconspicua]|uniref:Uncharacterized protein n=1 Tax=Nitzschia inconspicua TaxID=303405 RepID=A0A9K3KFB4_9STRA|nr:hypothetical protein IV203_007303 [Nitzschia inconspicua]